MVHLKPVVILFRTSYVIRRRTFHTKHFTRKSKSLSRVKNFKKVKTSSRSEFKFSGLIKPWKTKGVVAGHANFVSIT